MQSEEVSFKELDLRFFFVVKDNFEDIENVSSDMSSAYAKIREYFDESKSIVWLKEGEVVSKRRLTKKTIFVLDAFEGRAFDYLRTTKALIIGPRCLLSCLMESSSIPLGASPIFTTAMRNLLICVSALPDPEKNEIRKLVQWMGGYYIKNLSIDCTHLVSNTIKSKKYEQAALNNIPIMSSDWVHEVWKRSRTENIQATSKEFEKYKLSIFHSLYITSSGLTAERRNEIIKLITENGGNYVGSFKAKQTDVLIIEKDKIDSQKYQAAIRFKKDCLLPDWITDSVLKGYALPTDHYKVVALKVSTPNKIEQGISATDFNPDCTQLSEISRVSLRPANSTVNETQGFNSSVVSMKSVSSLRKSYKDCLAQISTQLAKKSGSFLDGCCIYLSGFTSDEKEKLNKILNVGSAIRYDEMNEKITHCIVGEPTTNELNKLNEHRIPILTLDWLAEAIKQKQPALEEHFIYRAKIINADVPEPPSPSSKKTIQSMNYSFKKPALPKVRLDFTSKTVDDQQTDPFENEQNEFLLQYTQQNAAALPSKPISDPPPAMAADSETDGEMCTEDYENLNFFIGFTVHVHDHDEEQLYQQLLADCENAGANVVDKNYKGVADYVIVPSEVATNVQEIMVKAKHIVNNLWIEDAIRKNKIVDVEYYHQPISIAANSKPLDGMIIVISIYPFNERIYIETLTKILGATKCDTYAKKQRPLLICPSPEGNKYNAALKWNFPVVKSDWLVECSNQGQIVPLEPYSIGDTVNVSSWKWNISKSSSSGASDNNSATLKKENSASSVKGVEKELSDDHDMNQLEEEVFLPPKSSPVKDKNKSITESSDLRYFEKTITDRQLNSTPDGISYLRHRRLSELADSGRRDSKGSSASPPITPPSIAPLNVSDYVKDISTPNRETVYNILKEMQSKVTPESQRIRKLVATPGANMKSPPTPKPIPDFVTSPEIRKRRLAFLDSYYLPAKTRRPSTPYSEVRKRFWKDTLGDQYFEEGNYKTQAFSQIENDTVPSTSTSNTRTSDTCENQDLAATNIHVQRLSDFIKNRDTGQQVIPDPIEREAETIGQKYDSEVIGGNEAMVGWRDPSEFSQDTRLKKDTMKFSGTPRFSISCLNDELKQQTIDTIKQLKGEVCENLVTFDSTCTHIVCERPNRGEKILSCIAAGKWILQLNYIVDSFEAGYFLDEELYEWGNPRASNCPDVSPTEESMANAAFRWRKKIAAHTGKYAGGAFQGFKVILHVMKKEQFQKLITAGGGVVLNVDVPYRDTEEYLQATHCLVEQKKYKLTPNDHKALLEAGVFVLSVNYLNALLTSETPPDASKYILSL